MQVESISSIRQQQLKKLGRRSARSSLTFGCSPDVTRPGTSDRISEGSVEWKKRLKKEESDANDSILWAGRACLYL